MTRRDLFAELSEGFDALCAERKGKLTLRHVNLDLSPAPPMTPSEIMGLRTRLGLSRAVFARLLRTNPRTLENWEQGRASPNAQAVTLIRLVAAYPDTLPRLEAIAAN